jgi:hypothetical protein
MIVRDEAGMLPRFLAAGQGLWDQLAVLDTGSVDGTLGLLREAGADLAEVEWPGDFAVARNRSLELATGDWVLVLDADEIVSPSFIAEVREFIGRPDVGAATVTMRNHFSTGHHRDSRLLRLFRYDPSIRYEHAIHEDASETIGAMLRASGLRCGHLATPIDHLGYQKDRAAEKHKKERDRTMLSAAIAADPADIYSRFKLLELARFWNDPEMGSTASQGAIEAIRAGKLSLRGSHVGGELLVILGRFLHSEDGSAGLALLAEFETDVVLSPSFLFGRGQLKEQTGDMVGAEEDFLACLGMDDPTLQMVTTRPLMGLARLCLARADLPAASGHVDRALGHSPQDAEALLAALSFRLATPGAVEAFLEGHPPSAALAAALESAVEMSATAYLRVGRVEDAYGRLGEFVSRCAALGVGMLVCDLMLGRSSDLDLDIELEEADRTLRRWLVHLMALERPELVAAFAANAPSVLGTFPWLRETLGLK